MARDLQTDLLPELLRHLPDRLRTVQEDVEDAEAALAHRRRMRRELVVETIDSGAMTQRQVARAMGKGPGLVHKLLAASAAEEE